MRNIKKIAKLAALTLFSGSIIGLGIFSQASPLRSLVISKIVPPIYVWGSRGYQRVTAINYRLYQGDSVFIPSFSDAEITLDYNQGFFWVMAPTTFKILELSSNSDRCGVVTRILVTRGRLFTGRRHFNCPFSRYETIYTSTASVKNLSTSESGFGVFVPSDNKRMVVAVQEGKVQLKGLIVPAGWGASLFKGQSHPTLHKVNPALKPENVTMKGIDGDQLLVEGVSNLLDTTYVNGVETNFVAPSGKDKYKWRIYAPATKNRVVRIRTVNPLRSQSYVTGFTDQGK